MKRFTIKKLTFVHRNTMIAGNPVDKRFKMACIYDRNWENEKKCLSFRGYQRSSNPSFDSTYGSYELRAAIKDEARAKELCAKMNEEYAKLGNPRSISFNVDNAWEWFDNDLKVTGFQE